MILDLAATRAGFLCHAEMRQIVINRTVEDWERQAQLLERQTSSINLAGGHLADAGPLSIQTRDSTVGSRGITY